MGKNYDRKRYSTPKPKKTTPIELTMDAEELVQLLRIKLWKMIARNNAEVLTDPLLKPLENSMPYITRHAETDAQESTAQTSTAEQTAETVEKVEDIKPTLDEVLPLPEQKQPSEKKAKKKAKDLLTQSADDSAPLPGQITVDEAISEQKDGAVVPMSDDTPSSEAQNQSDAAEKTAQAEAQPPQAAQKSSPQAASETPCQEATKRKLADVVHEHLSWRREKKDRDAYFDKQELQINNKNAACFEILAYLDELYGEQH